jgi:hypothetical protein
VRRTLIAMAATLVGLGVGVSQAAASTQVYSSVTPAPGNLPSVGFEATQVSEFGDALSLAAGPRKVTTVKVQLSSWACQEGSWNSRYCYSAKGSTFPAPITLNLYDTNSVSPNLPGALIDSFTQTFNVPYRPSANPTMCHGADAGKWWSGSLGQCFNGKVSTITFKVSGNGIQLPDSIVVGVAFDTIHYGYNPIGEGASCFGTDAGCPYDSLNFALSSAASVGSQVSPGSVFMNAAQAADYCDTTDTVTPGVFQLDAPDPTNGACWTGFVPAIQVNAS